MNIASESMKSIQRMRESVTAATVSSGATKSKVGVNSKR